MRVLLLSFHFPPFNKVGSIRASKTAKYLTGLGHEIRVVTAQSQPAQRTLALDVPSEHVVSTRWINIDRPLEFLSGGRENVAARGIDPRGSFRTLQKGLRSAYRILVKSVCAFPDEQIGWLPFAYAASSRLIDEWKPDVIYASASPYTSLVLGSLLSRKFDIPWVAELRDLWVENPYHQFPRWRRVLDDRLERRVLSSATGLVTVSEPLAAILRSKYGKPTAVVLNGYEPGDYPSDSRVPSGNGSVRLVYTGRMYEGKRDPSPLFEALQRLGPLADSVRVAFYGRFMEVVRDMARRHGVAHLVDVHDMVPHEESLRIQRDADVLLLLSWNDPREHGVYAAKLFEYIGARRPILGIGAADSVAAELIRNRDAGVVLSDAGQIADCLRRWIQQKQDTGAIPSLPATATIGLSREDQTRHLEAFMVTLVAKARPARRAADERRRDREL